MRDLRILICPITNRDPDRTLGSISHHIYEIEISRPGNKDRRNMNILGVFYEASACEWQYLLEYQT